MAEIIKCHVCKLDPKSCEHKCIDLDDVSDLYKPGITEKNVIPKDWCTAHKCPYNLTGFKCSLEKCAFGLR